VPNDPRRTIRIVAGDIERIVDEAESALIKAERGLYERDGAIVYVADMVALAADGRKVAAQRIVERGDHALLEDFSSAANFIKFDARVKADVSVDPPLWIARTLRQRVGRHRFDFLKGVVNTPTIRADGSILSVPGYDKATGLLFDPIGIEFPIVPDHPTSHEARAALAILKDLIETFPFIAEVDRSVALSAILTALVRRSLPTAPMHAVRSPVAGSGKTVLVDVASIIATGHEAGVIAQGATGEELEKRLGAVLLAGDPIVCIDNCEQPLGGELLCQMLTQTRVRMRILGRSATPELTSGAFIAATGNNLVFRGDLARRALQCSLDPKHERPETRVFDRNPLALANANRPRYVIAALTILRAFHVAGRPSTAPPLGSFEAWSNFVRGALLWLGCADPVASMDAVRKADPRLRDLAMVAEQWHENIGSDRITVAEVIRRAVERENPALSQSTDFAHPDFRDALLAIAGTGGAINSRKLGNWLSEVTGRLVDGRRFTEYGKRQGAILWALDDVQG
jgi:putative DNA primase/helicase